MSIRTMVLVHGSVGTALLEYNGSLFYDSPKRTFIGGVGWQPSPSICEDAWNYRIRTRSMYSLDNLWKQTKVYQKVSNNEC